MSKSIANVDTPETDITPEMIEAGVLKLYEYDPSFSNERDIVAEIFMLMLEARSP